MQSRVHPFLALCGFILLPSSGCQDYPFELRTPSRVDARQISEVVAQLTPADILFVVDNSGSMDEEINELQNNLDLFLDELSASDNQFQVGIITTDVECNVPTNDCFVGGGMNPKTSLNCCGIVAGGEICQDLDQDSDGVVDGSTCDGGRLRSANANSRRIFERPADDDRAAWTADVSAAIDEARNNLDGSTYEAGLDAAVTAVACAVGDASCPDPAVAQLNAGFIRPGADLVLIFLTDEDDCSVSNRSTYERLGVENDQTTRFCSPRDCYGYFGGDANGNAINDFVEADLLDCDPGGPIASRTVNPPGLRNVEAFLDELVALKGGDIGAVRAAGIISSVAAPGELLGFSASGCYESAFGPSADCVCLDRSLFETYCAVTQENGRLEDRLPDLGGIDGGCSAMPSGRYAQFLEILATRRIEASLASDVLIDSICNQRYDQTLSNIVNNVILSNCFGLGQVPVLARDMDGDPIETIGDILQLTLNDQVLPNVDVGSSDPGWSWIEGSDEVCLEGGLSKTINDNVEILLLASE